MLKKRRKIYHIEHFSELVQHPQQWSAFKDMMRFIVESDGSIDRFERLLMERFMIDFLGVDQKDAILQSDTTNLTLRHVKDQTKLLHHSLSDSLKMVAIQLLFKLALANHTIDKEEIKGIQLIAKIWKISEVFYRIVSEN